LNKYLDLLQNIKKYKDEHRSFNNEGTEL